jgi:preprotein translocase SecE subunit
MNRPTNVDFLIATDSEMKKVNWTSRKELMGSTKVVILFMFIMASYLFLMDVLFGYFFYAIGVVKEPPF